ncbi:hypothetical protein F4860DRAFT_172103 [Xylaria cubensis]|nr:hypothetical protein F4860DRAFT_172103 [Xylaria cubensis]
MTVIASRLMVCGSGAEKTHYHRRSLSPTMVRALFRMLLWPCSGQASGQMLRLVPGSGLLSEVIYLVGCSAQISITVVCYRILSRSGVSVRLLTHYANFSRLSPKETQHEAKGWASFGNVSFFLRLNQIIDLFGSQGSSFDALKVECSVSVHRTSDVSLKISIDLINRLRYRIALCDR